MAVGKEYLAFIEDQLADFGEVQVKKMFGGVGFFREGMMFGMLGGSTFRLKVDDYNQPDYEARDMLPYQNQKKGKGMPYWEVPADVLEDRQELAKWAKRSLEASRRSKK